MHNVVMALNPWKTEGKPHMQGQTDHNTNGITNGTNTCQTYVKAGNGALCSALICIRTDLGGRYVVILVRPHVHPGIGLRKQLVRRLMGLPSKPSYASNDQRQTRGHHLHESMLHCAYTCMGVTMDSMQGVEQMLKGLRFTHMTRFQEDSRHVHKHVTQLAGLDTQAAKRPCDPEAA